MIRVKAIGKNARIVGGSECISDSVGYTRTTYFISDLGSFYGYADYQDHTTGLTALWWVLKPDGTVPTQQDAIDAKINL